MFAILSRSRIAIDQRTTPMTRQPRTGSRWSWALVVGPSSHPPACRLISSASRYAVSMPSACRRECNAPIPPSPPAPPQRAQMPTRAIASCSGDHISVAPARSILTAGGRRPRPAGARWLISASDQPSDPAPNPSRAIMTAAIPPPTILAHSRARAMNAATPARSSDRCRSPWKKNCTM